MKTHIIIHHFNGTEADIFAPSQHHTALMVDEWHEKKWPGFTSNIYTRPDGKYWHVGYHKIFEKDGTVIICRGNNEEGAHTIGMNSIAIGYGIAGNFTKGSSEEITDAQKEAIKREALKDMRSEGIDIKRVVYHRKFVTYKDCPGSKFTEDYFQKYIMEDSDARAEVLALQIENNSLKNVISQLIKMVVALLAEKNAKLSGTFSTKSSIREVTYYSLGGKKTFMDYPQWYESSAGPGIASTVKGIVASLLPVINLILTQFGYGVFDSDTANAVISALIFLGTSVYTAFGYVRAKRVLGARIAGLESDLAGMKQ